MSVLGKCLIGVVVINMMVKLWNDEVVSDIVCVELTN